MKELYFELACKMLIAILLGFIIAALLGCGVRQTKAAVPGCPGAHVEVPAGCYAQPVSANRVEVRCPPPAVAIVYTCTGKDDK